MIEQQLLVALRKISKARSPGDESIMVRLPVMRDLIKFATAETFDEEWYLDRYPDVAKAIERGVEQSALDHFANSGLYEGRMPYPAPLDEAHYLEQHRDVAKAIDDGDAVGAADHFYMTGFSEGRVFRLEE